MEKAKFDQSLNLNMELFFRDYATDCTGPLPRRRSGAGRPVGRPSRFKSHLGRRSAALGRFRQAQDVRAYHQKAVRWLAEAEDDDPARLQES